MSLFIDGGNVWADDWSIALDDLRYAVGAGLRYSTPVGPIRLDWGYQLNPIDGLLVDGRTAGRAVARALFDWAGVLSCKRCSVLGSWCLVRERFSVLGSGSRRAQRLTYAQPSKKLRPMIVEPPRTRHPEPSTLSTDP